ncbi:hypothetical protein B0H14DRAFT_2804360 [Mycena olivaceomarginata]|nr:hypothetical protein B0H14DRAFT_2804360 [Mycena olivaceomarginata]
MILMTEADGMDSSMLQYQTLLGQLAGLELDLTKDARRYFYDDDLETKWMNASPDVREKHILIGLSNACSIARNLHDARVYCGRDFRLSRLRTDGKIVLGWLKAVMVSERPEEAMEILNKPKYVPDAAWDAFADRQQQSKPNDSQKLALGNILVLRTKLMCHFLHCTLRSFVGEEMPKISVGKYNKKKNPQSFRTSEFMSAVAEQTLGPAGAKAVAKENKAAWKERQKDRREHCSYVGCYKPDDGAKKFPRCQKCWDKMQREVLYCSKECQTADWKSGHKAMCGKPLTFDAVSKPKLTRPRAPDEMRDEMPDEIRRVASAPAGVASVPAALSIGAATGSYKRSPSLITQIQRLNKFPNIDYFITDAEECIQMDFPDPEAQSLVAVLAHFLCWMAIDHKHTIEKGATPDVIVGQLKKEYLFPELPLAVNEMQQRQNRDPLRRPVLLFSMSPVNWAKFSTGMNVHRQVVLS